MTSITVRNLDESIKIGLRLRAAQHGWSMEQEVRDILQRTLSDLQTEPISFAERVNLRFKGLSADELPIVQRQTARQPPNFNAK